MSVQEINCLVTKTDGKLVYEDRAYIARQIDAIPEGTMLEWHLGPVKNTRSAQANRLYWKWLTIIADDIGDDKNDLHEFLKAEFLEPKVFRLTDVEETVIERRIRPSTTRLTSAEFATYLTSVKHFALHRLNIVLPEPEDFAA